METIQIDLKKIIEKKSRLLANIPFLIGFLKRLICEDGVNKCLRVCGHLNGLEFVAGVLDFFQAKVEIETNPTIQEKGRYIFAANHPLGGLDGIALIKGISIIFIDLRFPVNDLLLNLKNFDPIFLPINKHGKQDRESVKRINDAYESDQQQILMFPSGLVSRKIKGEIVDLQWQKHFIVKAIQSKRDIVPVYIQGQNSNRFYRIANWRKRLGIKFNIEMLLLPSEMFKQKNQTIKIIIGSPIAFQTFDKSKTMDEWAEYVKQTVYSLKK